MGMQVTLSIPEELATRLRPVQDQLPQILEHGLRELDANSAGFNGLSDVLEALARLPTPDEVLALHPSPALQERIDILLDKRRSSELSPAEEREWEGYQYVEHLVRIAKAQAMLKRKAG